MPHFRGCPSCEWDGRIATTHNATHVFYTHVEIRDGTMHTVDECIEERAV